jgi:hypothetical protein
VDEQIAADIVWSMNSPEYYILLVQQQGWSDEQFEDWLVDAWTRLLLCWFARDSKIPPNGLTTDS